MNNKRKMGKEHIHDKVYASGGVGTNAGYSVNWICRICGEEGTDFTRYEDEYTAVKRKFNEL